MVTESELQQEKKNREKIKAIVSQINKENKKKKTETRRSIEDIHADRELEKQFILGED